MQHTIIAEIEVKFRLTDMPDDEHETAYPKVAVTYDYTPGRPAFTPRGEYAPIDPPEPAEVNFISAELVDGDGLMLTPQQVQERASDWLDDAGYEEACRHAEQNSGPDPDYAYEARRDDGQPSEQDEWRDYDPHC